MPGAWEWWLDTADEGEFDYAVSREDAIAKGLADINIGDSFKIVEARSSSAARYEGADFVPFTHRRNAQWITKTEDSFTVEDVVGGR